MRYLLLLTLIALIVHFNSASGQSSKSGDSTTPTPPKITSIAGKSLKDWIKKLEVADASIRTDAVSAIMQFGEDSSEAVPALLKRLRVDPDVGCKTRTLMALRMVNVTDAQVPEVVKAVAERLSRTRETQAIVRFEALKTLQRFETDAQDAIDGLVHAAADPASWEVRRVAVSLLWRVAGHQLPESPNGPDPRAIKGMIDAMKRKGNGYQVRLEALMGLAVLGKPADPALRESVVKELQLYTRGPREGFRTEYTDALSIWACAALTHMGEATATSRPTIAILAAFMKSKNIETRCQAIIALGTSKKEHAEKYIPELLKMLDDEELVVVNAACGAFLGMNDTSERVIDKLVSMIQPENMPEKPTPDQEKVAFQKMSRSAAAIQTLVNMKQRRGKVIDALTNLKDDKRASKQLQFFASQALEQLEKKDDPKKKDKDNKAAAPNPIGAR